MTDALGTEHWPVEIRHKQSEKLIEIAQTESFQPIYIRVQQGGTEPGQEGA